MNLRDLEYLVALADHEHFGKAANACFVSQPALSIQIKKLEEHLGVQLVERTNKHVILTDSGQAIAQQARSILHQVDNVREFAKSSLDPYSGELKLGIFPTLAPYLLPIIIPALTKALPKISFYLVEEQTAQLVDKLKNGKLHGVFLAGVPTENGYSATSLFHEEYMLATSRNHPLATLKVVQQKDLSDHKLLLLEEGHCMRDQALAICHKMKTDETQNFRATSLETLRHMVAAGVGITLIPKLAQTTNKQMAYIPFSAPKPTRTIRLVWRTESSKKLLLTKICELVKEIMSLNKSVIVLKN